MSFKDVVEETDLRTVTAHIAAMQFEEDRVGGLKEGDVISYRNRSCTRFRYYQKIWGRTCLVIPPYDPYDKHSLFLKESELLCKMSTLRRHQAQFEALTEKIKERKVRSAAWYKARMKK